MGLFDRIVGALFDRSGNLLTAIKKNVELSLLDTTLAELSRTGMTVKTSFDVKPGDYVVRLVVRDFERRATLCGKRRRGNPLIEPTTLFRGFFA